MVLLRYLLMFTGIGLLAGAAGILVWDLYQIWKSRKPSGGTAGPEASALPIRWDRGQAPGGVLAGSAAGRAEASRWCRADRPVSG